MKILLFWILQKSGLPPQRQAIHIQIKITRDCTNSIEDKDISEAPPREPSRPKAGVPLPFNREGGLIGISTTSVLKVSCVLLIRESGL
ncbi:hypothetical protein HY214_01680 [Candidatus Roizmanbacteria bacterium]|nr:hypothetical protein [Candidatus Roizmanbacteria bacterium]